MKNRIIKFAIAGVIIMGAISCSSLNNDDNKSQNPQQQSTKEIKRLPSFIIEDINGNVININSFKGKKVFVNLWASWCPPCREEIPSIESLKNKVSSEKAVFVMLSLDKHFDDAKKFKASNNMQLPVYYPASELPELFNIQGIPATFIFNEKGELIKVNNGADDYNTDEYFRLLNS